MRLTVLVAASAILTAGSGCDRTAAPPVASPAAASKSSEKAAVKAPQKNLEEVALKQPVPKVAEPPEPEEPKLEPVPAERILLLTPAGPLLMDVRLTLDGRPLRHSLDQLVDGVLAAASVKKEGGQQGRSTWAALIANDEYIKSQSRFEQQVSQRERGEWVKRYDANRDGQIQRDEAAAWLGRDSGRTATPFSLRSRRSYRPDPRATSRIWSLVDADGDGLASSDELHRAPDQLLVLDENDDEMLTPPELVSLRDQVTGAAGGGASTSRGFAPYGAIHVEADVDAARLQYLLNDLYAPRQDLQPASFGRFVELGRQLDNDEDGFLDPEELGGLLDAEPHLELAANFQPPSKPDSPAASIELLRHTAEVELTRQPTVDRMLLNAGGVNLVISAQDLGATAPRPAPPGMQPSGVERQQVCLMVHDQYDGLFQQLDANADGRLSAREVAECSDRLVIQDRDGDGQISAGELPCAMIVAFLRGESADEQSFYVPPATSLPAAHAEETPPWFRHADFNGDGDISRREFLGTQEDFAELDANRDGFVEVGEVRADP